MEGHAEDAQLIELLSTPLRSHHEAFRRGLRLDAEKLVGRLVSQAPDEWVLLPPKGALNRCTPMIKIERLVNRTTVTLGHGCNWDSSRPCTHQMTLLITALIELEEGPLSPAVASLRGALVPPGPGELLAFVDSVVGSVKAAESPATETRLCWRILLDEEEVHLEPCLRSRLKTGTWGKARHVPDYKRRNLRDHARTPQDVAFCDWMETYQSRGHRMSVEQLPAEQALTLLAGHPDVEVGEGQPVLIETARHFLQIVEHSDHVALGLKLGDREVTPATQSWKSEHGVIAWWPAERVIAVSRWAPETERVVVDLLSANIRMPTPHAQSLADRLAAVERVLPLSLPPSLAGREVPPDERITLVCDPGQRGGASITATVRPLADGPRHTVGEGDLRLSALKGDERLSTVRRFSTEREAATALFERLALPPTAEASGALRSIATDDELLDFVVRLQAPGNADVRAEWPEDRRLRVAFQSVQSLRVEIREKEDWFGVDGQAEVDGEIVALASLLAAARSGRRYVSLGPGRYARLEQSLRDRLLGLDDVVHETRGDLRMSSVAGALADEVFDGFEVVAPLAWRDLLARVHAARETTPVVPSKLQAELREYQLDGYRWLWRLAQMGTGGILADDMGLGKTVQAIAILLERAKGGPQLVVAPTSVGFNWAREIQRFAPTLKVHDFREGDREQIARKAKKGDVVIVSYTLLRQSEAALLPVRWHSIVLDEAQAFKNYETQTARTVRSLQGDWKIALTGTPVENHLGELYCLMSTVLPGLLGSARQFTDSFARPIEREKNLRRSTALARLLKPFILRRTKDQVLKELPARTEIRLDARLSKQERILYETTRLRTVAQLASRDEKQDARFVALAALTRLRQLACHARMVEPTAPRVSAKLAVLLDQLTEIIAEGHNALVFSQFTSQLALISEALTDQGIRHLSLDGSTPARERERLVAAFQAGEAPVFLISLKAGGTGLNLTAADYVFLMDPWWNPAVEDQAADRAHRIGQQRPVTIVRIVAAGTIEEKVLAMHERKRSLVAGVLDGTDVAGTLSVNELVDLLRDGQAVQRDDDDDDREPIRERRPG